MSATCRHCGTAASRHCSICTGCPGGHGPTCPRHEDNRRRGPFGR